MERLHLYLLVVLLGALAVTSTTLGLYQNSLLKDAQRQASGLRQVSDQCETELKDVQTELTETAESFYSTDQWWKSVTRECMARAIAYEESLEKCEGETREIKNRKHR